MKYNPGEGRAEFKASPTQPTSALALALASVCIQRDLQPMSKTLFFPFPIDGEQRLHRAMLVQLQLQVQPKQQDKNAESHINPALSPRQPSGHQRRVRRSISKMKAACFGRMLSHFPRQRKVFSAVQHFSHAGVLLEFGAQFKLCALIFRDFFQTFCLSCHLQTGFLQGAYARQVVYRRAQHKHRAHTRWSMCHHLTHAPGRLVPS